MVELGAFHAIDVGGGAAHWQEHRVHQRVVRHRRPAVRCAAHIGTAGRWGLLVFGVAWVEGPAHLPADHVETTDHASRHVGLHVIGDTPADHHGGAGDQRCRGQLVVAVRYRAQAGFQVHLAVGTEVFAEFTGVGIHGDQACIDGVGQQTALALRTGRDAGGNDRRAVRLGRLGDRRGGIEIGHATATLPYRRLGVDLVLPQLFAGIGVQRDQVVMRCADEHLVADLQGRQLVFGTVAVADGHVAGVVGPRHLELIDGVAVDLVQRRKTAAAFGIAVVRPIFLRVSCGDRRDARAGAGWGDAWVSDEHIARRNRHADGYHGSDAIRTACRPANQQRIHQRHHQADHRKHEQPREQRPEHQPHIRHRPYGRADQEGCE